MLDVQFVSIGRQVVVVDFFFNGVDNSFVEGFGRILF